MRRALLVGLGLLGLTVWIHSPAWAVERELAGVRLGAYAIPLLSRPGFGQPDFIGPLGAVGGQAAAAPRTGLSGPTRARGGGARAGAGGGGGGARARAGGGRGGGGCGGRGGGGRGGGGGGRRGALPSGTTGLALSGPSYDVSLTQMRGGGGGGRGGGGGGGGRGRAGGGGGRGGGGGGGAVAQAGTRTTAGQEATILWFYRRAGGATLVLALDTKGRVKAITLSGSLPYPPGRTSRNIGLSNDYIDVIRQYGYPDQAVSQGSAVDLTYVDHGVRFRLDGMRVTQITIGAYVAATVVPAPAAASTPAAPTPGLSIDELKGYM